MTDRGTAERRAKGGLVEEVRLDEKGVVMGLGMRNETPTMLDKLYFEGALGKQPEAGRRHQAGLAFAELHHLVVPSQGVGRYSPFGRSGGDEMDDTAAKWDSHLKQVLQNLKPTHGTILCNVCARNVEPKALELTTLKQALDALADFWELGKG